LAFLQESQQYGRQTQGQKIMHKRTANKCVFVDDSYSTRVVMSARQLGHWVRVDSDPKIGAVIIAENSNFFYQFVGYKKIRDFLKFLLSKSPKFVSIDKEYRWKITCYLEGVNSLYYFIQYLKFFLLLYYLISYQYLTPW
jgi:hypothetical protein